MAEREEAWEREAGDEEREDYPRELDGRDPDELGVDALDSRMNLDTNSKSYILSVAQLLNSLNCINLISCLSIASSIFALGLKVVSIFFLYQMFLFPVS